MSVANLKDKITVTPDFLADLISKNWQEVDSIQQQIDSIDSSTKAGQEVVNLLKNALASQYVFVGCLENISIKATSEVYLERVEPVEHTEPEPEEKLQGLVDEPIDLAIDSAEVPFEPFEYFVDFDEPIGDPLSDEDLYGNK
jgi:hypothetical protein